MTNTFLTLLPLLVIHMRLFVWKLLMDMFFCWKEFPGMVGFLFCQIINFSGLMMSDALRPFYRRDARKAVYLQHGILDSSMGWVIPLFFFQKKIFFS